MPASRTTSHSTSSQIFNPYSNQTTPSQHQLGPNPPPSSTSQPVTQRTNLSFFEKLRILDFYHAHEHVATQRETIAQLRVMGYTSLSQSTLSTYLKDEELIRAYLAAHPGYGHFKRRSSVKLPEVEDALYQWVLQKEAHHVRLTGALICEKAREFCQLLNVPEAERPDFSDGWLTRFKKRIGLRAYKFHGEAASAPVEHLVTEIPRIISLFGPYEPRDIFNADETALFFRLAPDTGLATHRISGLKGDKSRLTYLLCANMDGSEKRPPLVIGRAKQPRCFGKTEAAELGFYYFWNKTAWMVQSIWHIFLSDLNEDMKDQGRHILLLVDNASSHRHDPAEYSNIRIEFLPPNLTSWIQPMDAGIIRCFKAHYRNLFTRLALERDNEGVDRIYNITQLQAMRLATSAWNNVTPGTIANCWRHTRLGAPAPTFIEDSTLRAESDEQSLHTEIQQHPNCMHPRFQRMLELLNTEQPTEHEETEQDIANRILGQLTLND